MACIIQVKTDPYVWPRIPHYKLYCGEIDVFIGSTRGVHMFTHVVLQMFAKVPY